MNSLFWLQNCCCRGDSGFTSLHNVHLGVGQLGGSRAVDQEPLLTSAIASPRLASTEGHPPSFTLRCPKKPQGDVAHSSSSLCLVLSCCQLPQQEMMKINLQ